MAVSDVDAVLEFLRKYGLSESESALRQDVSERGGVASFDFESFVFPMVPPLPPVRIPASSRRMEEAVGDTDSSSVCSDDFVSLRSSATDAYSSEFTNPYGVRSATQANSTASSDSLCEFSTARDYPDFDMQNGLYWYDEKDDDYFNTSCFGGSESFGCPSEDKFVMTLEKDKQSESQLTLIHKSEGYPTLPTTTYLEKPCVFNLTSMDGVNDISVTDYYHLGEHFQPDGAREGDHESCAVYSCSVPFCKCCAGAEGIRGGDPVDYSQMNFAETDLDGSHLKVVGKIPTDCDSASEYKINKSFDYSIKRSSANDLIGEFKSTSDLHIENTEPNGNYGYEVGDDGEVAGECYEPEANVDEQEGATADELLMYENQEDEYEVFNLRIIHRKNRTGFEENKDLPIVLNTVLAGRYYITEYLGSAAFSKVVQAHDLHTEMDVCLKIIKNDKDFFDQSLDEIKLLKYVNKHDPADEHHILRLYDYFYHQEHLFIVCELLRANLYEFQKFNQESGGETYFTLKRLQVITRQCLEALEYLHDLGIIHCDLKPENILIKSYRRCEIKVIDLGSSCFRTDNLSLYVQSRSYRAPEVILGLPYDQRIDIWSLGCILAELCSGEVLFPNDELVTLLVRMIGMLGPIDLEMLVRGQETYKYFTKEYDLYHINEETNEMDYLIPEESSLEDHLQISDVGFLNFLRDLLEINPQRRPTAREALDHPWLSHSYDSNSS
ncbi:hypothetical protein PVL29_016369 [Vitis rotundifolia]|uniref:Protein kinase domain-containing protein n=1 Tax=Vitis rotundifolia TaxID=103349 RepID=A0AA38Z8G9_VITRO|nr:hypothetical protein PVL29_016369 [Vitis rotundifolia]